MKIVLKFFFVGLAVALAPAICLAESPHNDTVRFFTSIQDMPLMTGLQELSEQTLTFDKPEGRIVESMAVIESGTPETVMQFYNDTLPQLGWRRIAENTFIRESEMLILSFEATGGQNFLRVMIAPRGAKL